MAEKLSKERMAAVQAAAGMRVTRKARTTGTQVSLYDGKAAGMDTYSGRWQTACENHGTIISHKKYGIALSHLSHPEEWCEDCMGGDTVKAEPSANVEKNTIILIESDGHHQAIMVWDVYDDPGYQETAIEGTLLDSTNHKDAIGSFIYPRLTEVIKVLGDVGLAARNARLVGVTHGA